MRFGRAGRRGGGKQSPLFPLWLGKYSLLFSTDTMDFSGMSLIKLKKEEMETQVKPHRIIKVGRAVRSRSPTAAYPPSP